jgi:hypothetical protein
MADDELNLKADEVSFPLYRIKGGDQVADPEEPAAYPGAL